MECNPAILDHFSDCVTKFRPGDWHWQGLRCEQVDIHFISLPASLKQVPDQHRAFIGCCGAFERKRGDHDGDFASAEVAQSDTQFASAIKRVEGLSGFGKPWDTVG